MKLKESGATSKNQIGRHSRMAVDINQRTTDYQILLNLWEPLKSVMSDQRNKLHKRARVLRRGRSPYRSG
jgi:hypothetical protein